jgi:hypothetical protein
MLTMKQLTMLWFDTPRWARGLFLGNVCYVILAVLGFNLIDRSYWDQVWLASVFAPILWPMMGTPISSGIFLYHATWCVFGALFVQLFGESKGMIILACLLYGVGIAVIIYALTHFSFGF